MCETKRFKLNDLLRGDKYGESIVSCFEMCGRVLALV